MNSTSRTSAWDRIVPLNSRCCTSSELTLDVEAILLEDLERTGSQEWQFHQAEHALRLYFVNFLEHPDWHEYDRGTSTHRGADDTAARVL